MIYNILLTAVKEDITEAKAKQDEPEKKESDSLSTEGEKKSETDKKDAEKTNESSEEEKQETANCDNHKPSNNSHNKASNDQQPSTSKAAQKLQLFRPLLNKELEDWIWQDNRQFLQDRNIFEHTYFK